MRFSVVQLTRKYEIFSIVIMANALENQINYSFTTIINDDYEHPDNGVEYILENIPAVEYPDNNTAAYKILREQWNSLLMNTCSCCSNNEMCISCHGENYQMFIDNLNYPELVLKTLNGQDLIYECSSLCKCDFEKCSNRLVQLGPRKHLKIIYSEQFKSQGVITTEYIPKGAFVCEYAGELLTEETAQQRLKDNTENNKMNYILCLNELARGKESSEFGIKTIVDPSYRGNIGRYINHSCAPNCQIFSVRVDSIIPKIAIFTNRSISSHEELCFNYGGDIFKSHQKLSTTPCLCGSTFCQQFLPSIQF